MCTCIRTWVTMLYGRKKNLYWGNNSKKKILQDKKINKNKRLKISDSDKDVEKKKATEI